MHNRLSIFPVGSFCPYPITGASVNEGKGQLASIST